MTFEENTGGAPVETAPVAEEIPETEETGEEVVEEGQEAAPAEGEAKDVQDMSKKEQKELAKQLKKFKLKVDGKEEDFELDLNNEEEVKKHLQMSRASQRRMQEATELRKAAEQFIDMLRTNPRKVLSDPSINVDLKKLAQEYINEEIEQAAKSPEQIEKEKLTKELEELRERYKKDEEDRKSKEMERLQAEQEEKISTGIESALKASELPKTPYTVRKMAEMMMQALEHGIDLSPNDLIPVLRKQMQTDIKELFSASSDDVLEELIGKENITRVRKKTVAKVKQQQVAQTAGSVKATGSEKKVEEAPKKILMRDFLRG